MNLVTLLCRHLGEQPGQAAVRSALPVALGVEPTELEAAITSAEAANYVAAVGEQIALTVRGWNMLRQFRVDNAIILAAGFGSRFVPLSFETPKALTPVKGMPMIERQIRQLLVEGIEEIVVVVGYKAEAFDYLVERYGVKLVLNPEYAEKNNASSVYHALRYLKNSYLLVADNWIEHSVFHHWEPESWLGCTYVAGETTEWIARADADQRITGLDIGGSDGWILAGPAFLSAPFSARFSELVRKWYRAGDAPNDYWEDILRRNLASLPPIYRNCQERSNIHEFESLDELRRYDPAYLMDLSDECLTTIARTFGVPQSAITDFLPLKAGMTNDSFVFTLGDKQYVYRRPGAGTSELIDRRAEKTTYELIAPLHISDEIIYFDGMSGVKISRFYPDSRVTDPASDSDLREAMEFLRTIHKAGLQPSHRFDIAERIAHYDNLVIASGVRRLPDYHTRRAEAETLLAFRDWLNVPEVLCHIDYVFTNVLRLADGEFRIIDWEYGGAADPLIDIAMFAIYAYYSKNQIDTALRYYLARKPTREETARLYLYVALAGYLWFLWSEYKETKGDTFGSYPTDMLRYLEDYYEILDSGRYLDEFRASTLAQKPRVEAI